MIIFHDLELEGICKDILSKIFSLQNISCPKNNVVYKKSDSLNYILLENTKFPFPSTVYRFCYIILRDNI